ncbi:MAG: radical SAM protein [Candidatus Riflebacteria bacterium]|nr:radical SAM protein [Candidatus Riflebacteria bacterium]
MKLALHLTHDCNLRCVYCYVGSKDSRRMDRETAEQAVRFGHENSSGHLDISFFGGEPFLEQDLMFHVIEYAHSWRSKEGITMPLRFFATTNGLLLNEDTIRRSVDAGIVLSLSLDGHGACHDATRPLPDGTGSFARIAENFPALLQICPNIQVLATFSSRNIKFLSEGIEKLYYCGFRHFSVGLNYEETWSDDAVATMRNEYKALGNFYEERYKSGNPASITIFDSRIASHVNKSCERCACCDKHDGEIAVAPSGNIYPCLRLVKTDEDHSVLLGNVKTGMDRKLRAKIMVESAREWHECKECGYRGRCFHYCGAVNYKVNGRWNQPPHILCLEEQCSISVADEIAERLYKEKNPLFMRRFFPGEWLLR